MKKALPLAVLIAVLIFLGVNSNRLMSGQESDLKERIEPLNAARVPLPVTVASSRSNQKNSAQLPLMALLPLNTELRQEVARNPHQTPPSLLRFGADVGKRLSQAKKSETEASRFLTELSECGTSELGAQMPVQVQAMCLITASQLGKVWPTLHSRVEEILKSSDPKSLDLASRLLAMQAQSI